MSTDVSDLTKLSVNLTPQAMHALKIGAGLTGDSQTDTVNRALQVYAFLMNEQAAGRHVLTSPKASPFGVIVGVLRGRVKGLKFN